MRPDGTPLSPPAPPLPQEVAGPPAGQGRSEHRLAAVSVVVPTVGRPSLGALLESLGSSEGPAPLEVIVVDDRPTRVSPLPVGATLESTTGYPGRCPLRLVASGGRGPAAARNAGWRAASGSWIAFLDDDVVVTPTWLGGLATDLELLPPEAAGTQGRIVVPLPSDRRPTDWERNVAGLERACWATADIAYRRDVLEEVGGFDERFPRAFREDADLALRVTESGWLILRGERVVHHPVRPAGPGISIRLQAGNADDVLMRAIHGPDWRARCFAGAGRNARHAAAAALLVGTVAGGVAGRRRLAGGAALGWAAATAEFAWTRISPGPRDPREVATMVATSAVLPLVAVYHSAKGWASLPRLLRAGRNPMLHDSQRGLPFPTLRARLRYGPVPRPVPANPVWEAKAVLFDRDGTLIADRYYLKDPDAVTPMPGARMAVRRLRDAGLSIGVVTNQSGVGRGLISRDEMEAVNQRVEDLLGPFGCWAVCCHTPEEGCPCRKPAAGLVLRAAEVLGVRPSDCAVIGDIGSDMAAARRAGARAVLVPTGRTRREEVRSAYQVAPDLLTAVDLVLGGRC